MKKLMIVFVLISQSLFSQWVNDPLTNTIVDDGAGTHMLPKVSVNPNGTYYFSWYGGESNVNMNLTLFSHSGENLWENQSLTVSGHPQNSWVDDYVLLSDMDGNAIIVFSDIRENSTKNVVAYKIDSEKNQLWGEDGIVFNLASSNDYAPKAVITTDNNLIIVAGTEYSNGNDNVMKAYKIDENGNLVWGAEGKTYSGTGKSWTFPAAFANNDGGFSIGFYKETGSFPMIEREIAMIRCDADGNEIWETEAMVCNAGGIAAWDNIVFKTDGNGGAYFVWNDDRFNDMMPESYAQHVNSNGETQWEENGVGLSTEQNFHQLYAIPAGTNESGELVVFWNKVVSSQSEGAMMYQRISPEGNRLETDNGKTILPMSAQMQNGISAVQSGDSTFFLYNYFLPGSFYLVSYNMLLLDETGEMLWSEPTELCTSEIERHHAAMTPFNQNQAVVTWSDTDNGVERIIAQNIFTDGTMGQDTTTTNVNDNIEMDTKHFVHFDQESKTLLLKNLKGQDIITLYNIQGKIIFRGIAKQSNHLDFNGKGMYIGTVSRNGKIMEKFKIIN